MLINRVAGGPTHLSGNVASHFPPKMRSQLLLEGRVFMQSAGGKGKGDTAKKGQHQSYSDTETAAFHPGLEVPRVFRWVPCESSSSVTHSAA